MWIRKGLIGMAVCVCTACGSARGGTSVQPPGTTSRPNCPSVPAVVKMPSGSLPGQEQIKQLGSNGGGCYYNPDGAHSTATTGP